MMRVGFSHLRTFKEIPATVVGRGSLTLNYGRFCGKMLCTFDVRNRSFGLAALTQTVVGLQVAACLRKHAMDDKSTEHA
eukprot:1790608-Pyramimonas_sp.AAC.1